MITVQQMKEKEFSSKLRGYDKLEVDEFLDVIIKDYGKLIDSNERLQREKDEVESKLNYLEEMKDSLSKSVVLAQETSDSIKNSAEAEAASLRRRANQEYQRIIKQAELKGGQILKKATEEARLIQVASEELKQTSRSFHTRLLSTAKEQLGYVEKDSWEKIFTPQVVNLEEPEDILGEIMKETFEEGLFKDFEQQPNSVNGEEYKQAAPTPTPQNATASPSQNTTVSGDTSQRMFSKEEMDDLKAKVKQANAQVQDTGFGKPKTTPRRTQEKGFSDETRTFKLNI